MPIKLKQSSLPLSVEQAAAQLKLAAATYLSTSIDVVRDLIRNRQLPYIQNGRRYLLDRVDLDRYIEKIKVGVAARRSGYNIVFHRKRRTN
jgi:excisionase family DNA binding protein